MTADDRLELRLTGWMENAVASPTPPAAEPDYLAAVFASTRTARQRPAWTFPLRWLPWEVPESRARISVRIVAVALVMLALLASLVVGFGGVRALLFGDSAVGGGWRLLDGQPTARWELEARADPWTGTVSGRYWFERDGAWFEARVTCLSIVGTQAVVGGRVTRTNIDAALGFLLWLDDHGGLGDAAPYGDAVSFTLVSPDDPLWPSGTPDVPEVCPGIELPPEVLWRAIEGSLEVTDR